MIRPGDVIQLTHLNGEIKSLTRRIDETATLSVTRAEDGFSANIVENPLETEEQLLRGAVDSSLYVAVNAAGGTDRLAVELADVFKYDIDFVNQVQPGDSFVVAHEQQCQDGEFVRDGDILAAEFTNSGKTYRAVRYVGPNGRADYYTPDGRPVRKAFLRYPVDYARISSGFSLGAPPPGAEPRARAQGHRFRRGDRHADQGGRRRAHRQPRPQRRLRQRRRARAQRRRHHAIRPHVALRQGTEGRRPRAAGPGDRLRRHDRSRLRDRTCTTNTA